MKYFSKALSIKLKEQNMTQTELANLLNVKQQTVSRWITNTTEPDLETLKQICTI